MIVFILSILTSCSVMNGVITFGKVDSGKNYIEGKYNSFNGSYYKKVKLKKGDNIACEISSRTDAGSIQLLLEDEEGNTVADLLQISIVDIDKDGDYRFIAIANEHSGSFQVEWKVNE